MAEDPQETEHYGFPLMSHTTVDDYNGVWHSMYDDGYDTNNDGLIIPLDAELKRIDDEAQLGWKTTSAWDGNSMVVEDSNGTQIRFTSEE